jgi:hypothetical protein
MVVPQNGDRVIDLFISLIARSLYIVGYFEVLLRRTNERRRNGDSNIYG